MSDAGNPSFSAASVDGGIRFRSVGKVFPGTVALQEVSFDVKPGTCHAIVGENGAGKSTLGKILAGIHCPDQGHIEIAGKPHRFHSPLEAQRAGIGMVYQEFSLCPNLSVAENVCLTHLSESGWRVDWPALEVRARSYLDRIGAACDAHEELGRCSTGQRQMVQIAAALATGARILVMDEPTSCLSAGEVRKLEELIARLRSQGTTLIYVSHRMEEIFRLCDWVTVLRYGRHVATMPIQDTSEEELVRLMIGRSWEKFFPSHTQSSVGPERLRLEGFSSPGRFQDVTLSVQAGEVLGLAGLVGAGRSELLLAIFGLDPHATGPVSVDGREVTIRCPGDAIALGIGLASEDRKGNGLVLGMPCGQNVSLPSLERVSRFGILDLRQEDRVVGEYFARLQVKAASAQAPAQLLSGGNQQKLVLAKWLARQCRILLLDEPTQGIDVGTKAEIYKLLGELVRAGYAILLISSDLPELLNLSSRVMVMRNGRMAGLLDRAQATQERVMGLMAGGRIGTLAGVNSKSESDSRSAWPIHQS